MDSQLEALLNFYYFTTGRRLFSLGQMRKEAVARGLDALVALIDAALLYDRSTLEIEASWRRQKERSEPQLDAMKLDWSIDRTLSSIDSVSQATMHAEEAGSDLIGRIETFRAEVYPGGVQSTTLLPHVEELSDVERIMGRLRGDLAPMVVELNLERFVVKLEDLVPKFKEALEKKPETISFDTVRAARAQGQRLMLQAVAIVIGTFYGDSAEHLEARSALLRPVIEQDNQIQKYMRARRNIPDIDPLTGAPEPEEGIGEATTTPPEEPS
jgi:hypothetical protein